MTNQILTQAILKELLHYSPDTGVFTWRVYRSSNAKARKSADIRYGFHENHGNLR